jgi:hypothetical protein
VAVGYGVFVLLQVRGCVWVCVRVRACVRSHACVLHQSRQREVVG